MIFTLKISFKASVKVQKTRICKTPGSNKVLCIRIDSYSLAPDRRGS